MHVRKGRIINDVDLLKENQDLIKRIMAGMRRKIQVCLQRKEGHTVGRGNYPRILEIIIYYVFVMNLEIKIFYYYLLLDGFEYAYL